MKDSKDNKTLPLIPEISKRGRPPTGSSLTPAQRKAAQRARDRKAVSDENLSTASVTALCEQLQNRVSMGDVDLVKAISTELLKRTNFQFDLNVTVTKKPPVKTPPKLKVTVTKKAPAKTPPKPKVTVTKKAPAKTPPKPKVTVTKKAPVKTPPKPKVTATKKAPVKTPPKT